MCPLLREKQSIHPRNFTLMWPEPFDGFSPILHYIIEYKGEGFANFTLLKNVNATSNYSTVSIVGLRPYTIFVVRIIPVNRLGKATVEDPVQVTTAATCRQILNLHDAVLLSCCRFRSVCTTESDCHYHDFHKSIFFMGETRKPQWSH